MKRYFGGQRQARDRLDREGHAEDRLVGEGAVGVVGGTGGIVAVADVEADAVVVVPDIAGADADIRHHAGRG